MSFFGEPSLFIQDWQRPVVSPQNQLTNNPRRLILDDAANNSGPSLQPLSGINLGPTGNLTRPARPQSFSELPVDTQEILAHLFQADIRGNGNGQTSRTEIKNYVTGLNQQYETINTFSNMFGALGRNLFQPLLTSLDGFRKSAQFVDDAFPFLDTTPNTKDGTLAAIGRADVLAVASRDGNRSNISNEDIRQPGTVTTLAVGEEGGIGFPFPPIGTNPNSGFGNTLLPAIRGDLLFDLSL